MTLPRQEHRHFTLALLRDLLRDFSGCDWRAWWEDGWLSFHCIDSGKTHTTAVGLAAVIDIGAVVQEAIRHAGPHVTQAEGMLALIEGGY